MDMRTNNSMYFSFRKIIQLDLGEKQWQKLDVDIIKRFTCSLQHKCLRYLGTVNWIYCSPIGSLLAKCLKPFSLLPDRCARDSQFEFVIKQDKNNI